MNQEMLDMVVTSIVVPVLVALVPFLVSMIKAGTDYIRQRNKDKRLEKYINIAEDAVQTAVIAVYQTYVSRLKGTDGWSPEVQKKAFEEARRKAIAIMGKAVRDGVFEVYDDFDAWLDNKIEVNVYNNL
ncbi:MAG: hypothetical protein GT601_17530 [Acidaminobacter sp.]|uniref:phage holin, LLH family n=1 Tax=Acidaminobacter sp. TaxID=1872102 RepID=UPI001382F906|nr:phage holin, LLH family [Acidaminobacter sp.]MZQ99471.1 hypothetical protein [Acidaminobacter sp.]